MAFRICTCAARSDASLSLTVTNVTGDLRPVHRPTDMMLREFVLALSLMYLCDDPGLEEREDVGETNAPDLEGLWGTSAQPGCKMAPAIQEVASQPSRLRGEGRGDASVITPEEGGDRDVLEEDRRFEANGNEISPAPMGKDDRVDASLSPNRSGKAEGSQHRKHQVFPRQQSPLSLTSERGLERAHADREWDYLWNLIWNTFSIFSMIHFIKKYLGPLLNNRQRQPAPASRPAAEVTLPDSGTLLQFHSRCVRALSEKRSWEIAFLEGFASDLLSALRSVCGGVVIEDFQLDDSRNVVVPFAPPEPSSFRYFLQKDPRGVPMCGRIQLVEARRPTCCHCQSSDADDLVCLLHCETDRRDEADVCGGLWLKDSLLSKSQVTRWFQGALKEAWGIVSHRYEFELSIGYVEAPGALQVRFRSGKKVSFTMNPVVRFNADAHFVASHVPGGPDDTWTLSLRGYEERFFKQMTRHLPADSCVNQTLEIALFLHRRQAALTGGSELKDSHFKMALMHLLLITEPSQWGAKHLARRLRDLLGFVEKSLEKKMLHHVLVSSPLSRKVAQVPAELAQADASNLLHPLVMHGCLHRNAVKHFQEILSNAHILIDDYVNLCSRPEVQ